VPFPTKSQEKAAAKEYPFLLKDTSEQQNPTSENVSASLDIMQPVGEQVAFPLNEASEKQSEPATESISAQQEFNPPADEKLPEDNPLEEQPNFEMHAPEPEIDIEKVDIKPILNYGGDLSTEYSFPDYAESEIERIEYLIDKANEMITNHNYRDLNVVYRKIYNMYHENDLTSNERFLISEKVEELFKRIRRIYLIEEPV
jgi:hypothetical protein